MRLLAAENCQRGQRNVICDLELCISGNRQIRWGSRRSASNAVYIAISTELSRSLLSRRGRCPAQPVETPLEQILDKASERRHAGPVRCSPCEGKGGLARRSGGTAVRPPGLLMFIELLDGHPLGEACVGREHVDLGLRDHPGIARQEQGLRELRGAGLARRGSNDVPAAEHPARFASKNPAAPLAADAI